MTNLRLRAEISWNMRATLVAEVVAGAIMLPLATWASLASHSGAPILGVMIALAGAPVLIVVLVLVVNLRFVEKFLDGR